MTVTGYMSSYISKFMCELGWLQGVSYLIKDSGCQSRFREIHQKSRTAILHRFLRDDDVEKKMSGLVRSSGVRCADVLAGANRGAVRVIGNLLVSVDGRFA